MNKLCIFMRQSSINAKRFYATERKRFYKQVIVSESGNDQNEYEINLDKRKLKTPNGKLFQVKNEILANLIAHEWNSQDNLLKQNQMHLTSLANTCIDNPGKLTKELLIGKMRDYIETDTILFREPNSQELFSLQNELWNPYVNWANQTYQNLNLVIKNDIDLGEKSDFSAVERYLNSFNLNALIAINYICENLKSVILALALINQKMSDTKTACDLAMLETQFQTSKWGKLEYHHTFDEIDLRCRVNAAYLFFYFNTNFTSLKNKF
jgi:ATP synthase mitochondrial F1 complex assembly factor 2